MPLNTCMLANPFRTVCVLSVATTVIGFLLVVLGAWHAGLDPTAITGDSRAYVILANNIINHGVYSVAPEEPFSPESFRSPGYPAFLSILFTIVPWPLAALFVHTLISGFAPILLYLFARKWNERAAFWAAILFSFDPVRLFLAASFLTDSLFVVLFFASLVALEKGKESTRFLVLSAFFLGVAILVRPIAQFLPLVYAIYLLATVQPVRKAALMGLLLVAAAYLVVAPWSYRNHILFDSWNVSAVGAANLVVYNAPEYLKWFPDERGSAILAEFQAKQESLPYHEALTLARSAEYASTFREIIRGHEISYVFFHVVKTIPFFLTDGLRDMLRLFIDIGSMPNLSTAIMSGDVSLIVQYLRTGGIAIAMLLIGTAFWGIISLMSIAEGVRALVKREWFPILFYISIIGYFALLTGPVANARYRLPVAGIMIFLALRFLYRWYDARHERV